MTKINIVGAGLSGLLAANVLRRHEITIYEMQKELPNNHHAVLRFRSPFVGQVLGIPFKKVNMLKTYVPSRNMVADSISYSMKTTGMYTSDRSIIDGTITAERHIAPENLIIKMADGFDIKYGTDFDFLKNKTATISTIPMPNLIDLLDYQYRCEFKSFPGTVITAKIKNCDAYVSVLFPGECPYSRATITGNQLMIEFPRTEEYSKIENALYDLGINQHHVYDYKVEKQKYFKILGIEEPFRKGFQRFATVNHKIYSLGRYATWRPKLLLDDLISDIKKIEEWITGGIP